MKYVMINPGKISGKVLIPASKSMCHRALICAGLSEDISNIHDVVFSKDVDATCSAMASLGVDIEKKGNNLSIRGKAERDKLNPVIDCNESGSTLRFLIPVAAALGKEVTFTGAGGLAARPLQPYYDIFDAQKIKYKNVDGKLPLTISGKLSPGEYRVKGNISSQFISGLLFALPILNGDSKIIITTDLESRPYIDLTLDMLKKYSIIVENNDYKEFYIKGNQKYAARDYKVEGDFSQAAFFLAAGVLGEEITCDGLDMNSLQGDKAIIDIIKGMGGEVKVEDDKVKAYPSKTKGTTIDVSQCPDLVPILAVLGALSEGTTEIINAERLRIKESDRLRAISDVLSKLGAEIDEKEDGLIIKGKRNLKGGTVDSWNDHRIAMAAAVASVKCTEPVVIKGADSVKKSYPEFWTHFAMLGGNMDEWSMGE